MTDRQIAAKLNSVLEEVYQAQREASSKHNWDRRDHLADIASGIRVAISQCGR